MSKLKNKRRGNAILGVWFSGYDGRRGCYLNAALPHSHATGHPAAGPAQLQCVRCGHGYSHMLGRELGLCDECRQDDSYEAAIEFQRQGVNLGWVGRPTIRDLIDIMKRNGYRVYGTNYED